jgi:hypothetical protein
LSKKRGDQVSSVALWLETEAVRARADRGNGGDEGGGSDSCTRGGGQEVLEEGGRLPGVNDAKWRCDRDPCGGGDARSRGVGG